MFKKFVLLTSIYFFILSIFFFHLAQSFDKIEDKNDFNISSLFNNSFENFNFLPLNKSLKINFAKHVSWSFLFSTIFKLLGIDPLIIEKPLKLVRRDSNLPQLGVFTANFTNIKLMGFSNFQIRKILRTGKFIMIEPFFQKINAFVNYSMNYNLFDLFPLNLSKGSLQFEFRNVHLNASFLLFEKSNLSLLKLAKINLIAWTNNNMSLIVRPQYIVSKEQKVTQFSLTKISSLVESLSPNIIHYLKFSFIKLIEVKFNFQT